VADGKLFVGSGEGYVYALDEASGSLVWKYFTGEDYPIDSSPAVADGVVYIGAFRAVYAFGSITTIITTTRIETTITTGILPKYFVGGELYPANNFAVLVPYIALIGLAAAAVAVKKWKHQTP
jgi:outer membrane protein assembly factor BamB